MRMRSALAERRRRTSTQTACEALCRPPSARLLRQPRQAGLCPQWGVLASLVHASSPRSHSGPRMHMHRTCTCTLAGTGMHVCSSHSALRLSCRPPAAAACCVDASSQRARRHGTLAVCTGTLTDGRGQSLPHTCTALGTGKRVYVHCTAGLGRAPAACIAYLFWASQDESLREGGNWSLNKARLPTLH